MDGLIHEHPYLTQTIALWLSFVPCFAIGGIIVGAWAERGRGRFRVSLRVRERRCDAAPERVVGKVIAMHPHMRCEKARAQTHVLADEPRRRAV